MNMRRLILPAAAFLALSNACVATSANDEIANQPSTPVESTPFFGGFLKRTQLIYPIQIDDWRFDGHHRYEQKELGVSLRYVNGKHPGSRLDVFVYPGGLLEEADVKRMAGDELAALAQPGHPGNPYSFVDQGRLREFSFRRPSTSGKDKERVRGFSMDMRVVRDEHELNSIYLLLVDRLYLVKVRHSAPAKDRSRRKLRKLGESFLEQFVAGASLNSTGECWRTVPVEPIAGQSVDESSVLIKSQVNDSTSAYVLQDRILTDAPESPDILLLQMLRMIATGQWVDGCVAPEWLQRDPEAGQGEIFIAYE